MMAPRIGSGLLLLASPWRVACAAKSKEKRNILDDAEIEETKIGDHSHQRSRRLNLDEDETIELDGSGTTFDLSDPSSPTDENNIWVARLVFVPDSGPGALVQCELTCDFQLTTSFAIHFGAMTPVDLNDYDFEIANYVCGRDLEFSTREASTESNVYIMISDAVSLSNGQITCQQTETAPPTTAPTTAPGGCSFAASLIRNSADAIVSTSFALLAAQ